MDELGIKDSEITADASLDGASIHARWLLNDLAITWERDGKVLAGLVLREESARALLVVVNTAFALVEMEQGK